MLQGMLGTHRQLRRERLAWIFGLVPRQTSLNYLTQEDVTSTSALVGVGGTLTPMGLHRAEAQQFSQSGRWLCPGSKEEGSLQAKSWDLSHQGKGLARGRQESWMPAKQAGDLG